MLGIERGSARQSRRSNGRDDSSSCVSGASTIGEQCDVKRVRVRERSDMNGRNTGGHEGQLGNVNVRIHPV